MKDALFTRTSKAGKVSKTENGFRLAIPEGGKRDYRVAQIDDYAKLTRRRFPHQPPLQLSLRARASAGGLPGTWGFGLWNDPFGASIGFGGNPLRLPALPNALWFFHASKENHLSFGDNPGSGFLAQSFRSPGYPLARLAKVGLCLPFARVKARRLMAEIVTEACVRTSIDTTKWHAYHLEWTPDRSSLWVDRECILDSSVSPRPPLGLVLWIDNQYAAFTPEGKIGFGVLEHTEPAWLEIADLELI